MDSRKIALVGAGVTGAVIAYYLYTRRQKIAEILAQDEKEPDSECPSLVSNELLDSDHFECGICWSDAPMSCSPSCGHAICGICLRNHLQKGVNKNCAFCREPLPNDRREYTIRWHQIPEGAEPSQKELDYCFHHAVSKGKLDIAKLYLECGADVKSNIYGSATAIFFAVIRGHDDLVNLCLEHGADVRARDQYGRTLLHGAARAGHIDMMQTLLSFEGTNIDDCENETGETPMQCAIANGSFDAVKFLVEKGADIKTRTNRNMNAIEIAAILGAEDIFGYLFDCANVTDVEDLHRIACKAIQSGSLQILEDLEPHIDIVSPNDICNPLLIAARVGLNHVVHFLLEKGADPNTRQERADPKGHTPLLDACESCRPQLMEILCEYGADVNCRNDDLISPLLTTLVMSAGNAELKQKSEDMFHFLIDRGAEFTQPMEITPFPEAMPNLTIRQTYLSTALMAGNMHAARFFVQNGADVNYNLGGGLTLLHMCVQRRNAEGVQLLCENEADLSAKTDEGIEPIQYARNGFKEMLISYGANPNLEEVNQSVEAVPTVFDIRRVRFQINMMRFGAEEGVLRSNINP